MPKSASSAAHVAVVPTMSGPGRAHSVMATENALLAAALTPGDTVIGNAACEPHVQDLARMLQKMGTQITGIGSNVIRITGQAELFGITEELPRLAPLVEEWLAG